MTERQKAYQEYLESDHWHRLRSLAIKRDKCCVRCKGHRKLQVHHKIYRDSWYDTLLSDLETLCRKCHKKEHGISPWGSDEPDIEDSQIPEHAFTDEPNKPPARKQTIQFPVKETCPFADLKALEFARGERLVTREQFVRWKNLLHQPKPKRRWHYRMFVEEGRITRWKNIGRSSN